MQIYIKIINLYEWQPLQKTPKLKKFINKRTIWEIEMLQKEFAIYILRLFKSLVLFSIKNQKFRVKFPPLSPNYVAYKKRMRGKLGFWEFSQFLQSNLQYWRLKKGSYAIGFKRNIIHPMSGEKLYKIAKWVEGGTSRGIPPRPLFRPIATSISKHIYDIHFKNFIKSKFPEYEKYLI